MVVAILDGCTHNYEKIAGLMKPSYVYIYLCTKINTLKYLRPQGLPSLDLAVMWASLPQQPDCWMGTYMRIFPIVQTAYYICTP